jgi:hypothetical protein
MDLRFVMSVGMEQDPPPADGRRGVQVVEPRRGVGKRQARRGGGVESERSASHVPGVVDVTVENGPHATRGGAEFEEPLGTLKHRAIDPPAPGRDRVVVEGHDPVLVGVGEIFEEALTIACAQPTLEAAGDGAREPAESPATRDEIVEESLGPEDPHQLRGLVVVAGEGVPRTAQGGEQRGERPVTLFTAVVAEVAGEKDHIGRDGRDGLEDAFKARVRVHAAEADRGARRQMKVRENGHLQSSRPVRIATIGRLIGVRKRTIHVATLVHSWDAAL